MWRPAGFEPAAFGSGRCLRRAFGRRSWPDNRLTHLSDDSSCRGCADHPGHTLVAGGRRRSLRLAGKGVSKDDRTGFVGLASALRVPIVGLQPVSPETLPFVAPHHCHCHSGPRSNSWPGRECCAFPALLVVEPHPCAPRKAMPLSRHKSRQKGGPFKEFEEILKSPVIARFIGVCVSGGCQVISCGR